MKVKDLRTGRIIETDNPYFQRVLFLQGSRYQTVPDDIESEDDKPASGSRKKTKKSDESTPESEE